MDEIKKKLEAELNRTVERIRQLGGSAGSVQANGVVGDTSKLADEVDVIQVNEDREMNFATRNLLVERANRLAEALERLRGGEYGTCLESGDAIAPARLKPMPVVSTSVRSQDRFEKIPRHMAWVGASDDDEENEDD